MSYYHPDMVQENDIPVRCLRCERGYAVGVMNDTQANGCAASIWQDVKCRVADRPHWYLQGHYPSRHDTNLYRFVRNEPATRMDPVCDACCDEIVASGDVEFVGDGYL